MKKIASVLLAAVILLSFAGCSRETPFSFAIRWGVSAPGSGSSYDSGTGVLVKTTQASDPSKFRTVLKLNRQEREELRRLAERIDFSRIPPDPEPYDPYAWPGEEARAWSKPLFFLEVTVRRESGEASVRCFGIPQVLLTPPGETSDGDPVPADENGKAFEAFVRSAFGTVYASKEWQSLPDYEVLYQ